MDPNIGEDSRWSFCPDVQSVMLEMGKKPQIVPRPESDVYSLLTLIGNPILFALRQLPS